MTFVLPLPRWAEIFVLPIFNLLAAFSVSALVIWALGENPFHVLHVMIKGAFVYEGGLGYTLYYATNFLFTGLAVAVAFHARLFNIGGEGQAALGGLGVALVALNIGVALPWFLLLPLLIVSAAAFGAFWGLVPGYLQAKRGSHIVITTIMFNLIASAIMVALLSGVLMAPGQMSPQTLDFVPQALLPKIHGLANRFLGLELAPTPLNMAFFIGLFAAFGVWLLIWRTRLGYAIRVLGANPQAAHYAGISTVHITVIVMALSGALAGMMALNEVLGANGRLTLNFTAGYGFTGIAVALIGRNHPVGIILASLLFGFLYQGGTEIDFEFTTITREMVLLIQGLMILFSGALYYLFSPWLARFLSRYSRSKREEG